MSLFFVYIQAPNTSTTSMLIIDKFLVEEVRPHHSLTINGIGEFVNHASIIIQSRNDGEHPTFLLHVKKALGTEETFTRKKRKKCENGGDRVYIDHTGNRT